MKKNPVYKCLRICIGLFCFSLNHLSAQKPKAAKPTLIVIHLSDSGLSALHKKPIVINAYTHYIRSRESVDGQRFSAYPDSTGNCRFDLPPSGENFFVSISPLLSPFGYQTRKLYLVNPGDSMEIIQLTSGYRFTGKGSDKMNCQYQLFQLAAGDRAIDNRKPDIINTRQIKTDSLISLKKKIIGQCRLGSLDKEIIITDAVASSELSRFSSLKTDLWFNAKDTAKLLVAHQFYRERFLNKVIPLPANAVVRNSACFSDAIFARLTTDLIAEQFHEGKLNPANRTLGLFEYIFLLMHRRINQEYNGYLRDKLLTTLYAESFYSSDSTDVLLQADCRNINEAHLKTIVRQIADAKMRRQPVNDFALPDQNGKMVHLSDFRGKAVVLDFWFTGCTNCIKLTTDMRKVVERYAKDTNVVFISVSADTDKAIWLASVASGQYTHKTSINVYTNGEGDESPIIRRYNYLGYPKLLLVSKKGELISADPPRPDNEENLILFNGLIEQALQ
jgi:thiol-disulfide isomerase/thioredoxin